MKKGFEYWKSSQLSKLLSVVGLGYFFTYLALVWLSVHHRQPLIFLGFALLPYAFLKLWKIIRSPFQDIDKRINEIDPAFYKEILNRGEEELKKAKGYLAKKTVENKKAYFGLWLWGKPIKNHSIRVFVENIKKMDKLSEYILFAWFSTSIILGYLFSFT